MGRALKIAKQDTSNNLHDLSIPGGSHAVGAIGGNTAITGYQIVVRVKIGTVAEANGYIIRQKGKKKFLVADTTGVTAGSFIVGNHYVITALGNTNWAAIGADPTAAVGAIFTATGVGSGTGTADTIGVCTLADLANGALTANTMTISFTDPASTVVRASRISNRYVWDFSNVRYFASMTNVDSVTGEVVAA